MENLKSKNMRIDRVEVDKLVRLTQIIGEGGLMPISRGTFYGLVNSGELPKPIKLTPRTSAWRKSDIIDYVSKAEKMEANHDS